MGTLSLVMLPADLPPSYQRWWWPIFSY